MTRLRVLVVDDEPIARRLLRGFLERQPDIEILGECRGGREAVIAIRERRPDLVFLDVRMPDLDGFQVLEQIPSDELPRVIFVTAYDEYALRAFRFQALDYLLKPFDEQRFRETLDRARRRFERDGIERLTERLEGLLRRAAVRPLERLAVKKRGISLVVKVEEIDWIESEANYVRLHCGDETHLIRRTLQSLEEELDPFRFVRIHRTAIVNADRIRGLIPCGHGDMKIVLVDGTELSLSRRYRERLERVVADVR